MDARGPGQRRQIGPVVDDHRRLIRRRHLDDVVAQCQEGTGCQRLGSNLNEPGSTVEEGVGESDWRPSGATAHIDIDNGVEWTEKPSFTLLGSLFSVRVHVQVRFWVRSSRFWVRLEPGTPNLEP
jgi:hypothetical protein